MGCPDADLSIVCSGDDEIGALNATYRQRHKATDVLSFSQIESRFDSRAGDTPALPTPTPPDPLAPEWGEGGKQLRPQRMTAKAVARRSGAVCGPRLLGDVVISYDAAARQAAAGGWSLESELRRLVVHGVLHLLGHDHVHGGLQAKRMRAEERRLVGMLRRRLGPC